ncbi:response regulator transcription factor [Actinocorallia sp. B10E7]|uniref:response regulator transcription factor n=1 Tax=Actinocorallia sp. B10E7 TaxID=3153558 RepID=UPI00325D3B0D
MPKWTIVLVDDHVLFREGVRRLLEQEPDLSVVGEAGDSREALELITGMRPHLVLLDVEIPGAEVTETVRAIKEVNPDTCVIVLSMYDESSLVRRLIDMGISGYLLKSVSSRELIAAIRTCATGGDRLLLAVSRESMVRPPEPRDPCDSLLSRREREVLELTAQAMSNSQIASRLFVAEATVKRHLHNAFRKLGAVSRIDAVNKAKAAAIIPADPARDDRPVRQAQSRRE